MGMDTWRWGIGPLYRPVRWNFNGIPGKRWISRSLTHLSGSSFIVRVDQTGICSVSGDRLIESRGPDREVAVILSMIQS